MCHYNPLYDYLKNRMMQYPDQIICEGNVCITYHDLLCSAELHSSNLVEAKYGILFNSNIKLLIALLACFCVNKVAVVLSPKYGELHTRKIIDATKLSHIITDTGVETVTPVTPEKEELSDVAVIMCTSGTTGTPKGAMLTYDNILNNLMDIDKYFAINSDDHILIARPPFHSAVLTGELLLSLIKGLKISFYAEGFVPNRIIQIVKEKQISVLCGTPTLLYHISKYNLRNNSPIQLRCIAISGECLTETVAKTMRKSFPSTEIYSVYGLTEAGPRVSYLPPDEFDEHPLSVGYPLDSVKIKIKDSELLVKGSNVMKGYYMNPSATRRVLQDGWLHTGDIAEMDNDGRIYIKCRKDDMIIRAGMNIYPQEIENVLKSHPKISDVLVYGLKRNDVSETICINIVTTLSKIEIFRICKEKLPGYELPDIINIVEEIPRNASGKAMRNVT